MRPAYLYLALCVPGTVLPLSQFLPWAAEHGLDLRLFVQELFSTRIGGFFGWDLIVAAVVLFAFIAVEARRLRIRHAWAPAVATVVVGLSLGLPLFLAMREFARERG